MIHIDETIQKAESWFKEDLAISGGDAILSAFTDLRIIGSDILDVICDEATSEDNQQGEILLALFNGDLDKWEKRWQVVFDAGNSYSFENILEILLTHLS